MKYIPDIELVSRISRDLPQFSIKTNNLIKMGKIFELTLHQRRYMNEKNTKSCSTAEVVREIQIQNTTRHIYIYSRVTKIK